MIILPKVPHSLRSLTQSFARSLNPSSSASAQPSVTFSSQGSSVHVIGGGGPFTHNSALLGGGALTRTGGGSNAGTGIGFENWAPASGGGGGAGAGSRNPGAGSYGGYTGHARALIQSTPSAATDMTSLTDDDDAEFQSALSLHRLRVRSTSSITTIARPDRRKLGPQNDEQLKIIRRESLRLPEVQRRLRSAFTAKPQRDQVRDEDEPNMRVQSLPARIESLDEVMAEAEDQIVDDRGRLRLGAMERRERGRSTTPSPLVFVGSSASLGRRMSLSVASPSRPMSSSARRYSASSAEEATPASPAHDPSTDNHLSPRGSPSAPSSSIPPPPPSSSPSSNVSAFSSEFPPTDSLLLSQIAEAESEEFPYQNRPADPEPDDEVDFSFDSLHFESFGSVNDSSSVALPTSEPTDLSSSSSAVPSLDLARRAEIEHALETRDVGTVMREVRKYIGLPSSKEVTEGGMYVPQQTTETFNVALRALASVRPPGAPVHEILQSYSRMLRNNIVPDVETYSIVIRVLCEREIEIQEAYAFEKELRRLPMMASRAKSFRTPPNLLPLPSLHTFVNTPDFSALKAERNLDQAINLFTAASSFSLVARNPFPIEAYDALLKACAKAGRAEDALAVFVDLEEKVGAEGGVPGTTFQTWQSMVEVYGRSDALDATEDVFEEFREAETDGRIVLREERARHVDSDRIPVWNSLVDAYFRNESPTKAIGVVESLTDPSQTAVAVAGRLPLPAIHASTLTSVIRGFIHTDDLDSALHWFKRIVPEGDAPAPTGLPPLEPIAFVSLLSIASRIRDHAMYDLVFDRFTAHPPQGYHFRPVELAEAILLHLEAGEVALTPAADKNYHLDRIFHFVDRCDKHERSKYLYPPSIAGSLLRMLIEQDRSEVAEVYVRSLRSGQENQTDPLAAIKFHAYFFESVVHWLTTPATIALDLSIASRLRLIATLVKVADSVDVPTDLSTAELAPRIVHLYSEAKKEVGGDLRLLGLDDAFVTTLIQASGINDLSLLQEGDAPQAVASSTLVTDLVQLYQATGEAFQVDWTFAGKTIVAAGGVDHAIEVLQPLGEEVLYASGAIPRPPPESQSDLDPTAASFVPEQAPHASDPALSEYESTAVSTADASEFGQSQTSLATTDATSIAAAVVGPVKLIIDKDLSELVDLHYRPINKVNALQSYEVLKDGVSRGYTPYVHVLSRLLVALGRLKDQTKVTEVLELAHNVCYAEKLEIKEWYGLETNAIVAYAHCGDIDRANFHRFNLLQNQDQPPKAEAYAALINGSKDTTDDAAIARELFQEAMSLGVKPTLFLFNSVISALSKARKAEEALALYFEVQSGDHPFRANTVTYGAVINGCCRVGDIDTATRLFSEMVIQPDFKPRVPPYNTMMQYFTTAQPDRARVLHYYDELVRAGVQPSSHTYNLLMLAYGTIEPVDLGAMEKVFDTLRTKSRGGAAGVEGLHLATLINCHGAAARNLTKALESFDSIAIRFPNPRAGHAQLPDAVCWEAIFNVLLVHRRFDLLQLYRNRFAAQSTTQTTTYIENVHIKAYAAEGKIEKAREVFFAMENPRMGAAAPGKNGGQEGGERKIFLQPSSYEAMIRAELGPGGDRERAVELCNMMEGRMYPLSVTSKIRSILGEAAGPHDPSSTTSAADVGSITPLNVNPAPAEMFASQI